MRWKLVGCALLLSLLGGCNSGDTSATTASAATPPITSVSISATVLGLPIGVRAELTLNNSETILVTESGATDFKSRLKQGDTWDVVLKPTPEYVTCTVDNPRGTAQSVDVVVLTRCTSPLREFRLVKDVNTQPSDHGSFPNGFNTHDGKVAFLASSASRVDPLRPAQIENLAGLHLVDGTGNVVRLDTGEIRPRSVVASFGTRLLVEGYTESGRLQTSGHFSLDTVTGQIESLGDLVVREAAPSGNRLFFFSGDPGDLSTLEPWISDGTAAGTFLLKDATPGFTGSWRPEQRGPQVLLLNNTWFFVANDNLWRSDGTEQGTVQVPARAPLRGIQLAGVHNNRLFFFAGELPGGMGNPDYRLWSTDGTSLGEVPIQNLHTGVPGPVQCFSSTRTGAYYTADVTEGGERVRSVWFLPNAGPAPVKVLGLGVYSDGFQLPPPQSTPDYACQFKGVGDRVVFPYVRAADINRSELQPEDELWVSDGTAAGTRRIDDKLYYPNSFNPASLYVVNERVVMPRVTPEQGIEFWWTDGTRLELVADINSGAGSSLDAVTARDAVVNDGRLYFSANSPAQGGEPWVTDTTPEGTRQLANIRAETRNQSGVDWILGHTPDRIFFSGCDGNHRCGLWIADGSPNGTSLLREHGQGATLSNQAFVSGNKILYSDGVRWLVSDGTVSGTGELGIEQINDLASTSRGWVFASDGGNGAGIELWRTDGTDTGTEMLADLVPGPAGSFPCCFAEVGNWIYFRAFNGQISEVWRIDQVTRALEQIPLSAPGASGVGGGIVALNANDVVFAAFDPDSGSEPWISRSGAPAMRLADIHPGTGNSIPHNFHRLNERLFFAAQSSADRYHLWSTSGVDVREEADFGIAASGLPHNVYKVINGKLFFYGSGPGGRTPFALDLNQPPNQIPVVTLPDTNSRFRIDQLNRLNDEWVFHVELSTLPHLPARAAPFVSNMQGMRHALTGLDVWDVEEVAVGPLAGLWLVASTPELGRELWLVR